ncbi:CinA family protein [Thioclava litoralis]|uniref:CinA family protein n=1 Tax=Thioclava litoralis TaxID=3076557 RepID=A0ABZ1DYF7_9RHOB|nr:CinA family protein [Thioclava sp. FTW29]
MSDLAPRVIAEAKARAIMIATAESCTAGLIAAALTDLAGSSAVFERGFVTYSNAAKTEMLGVPAEMIARYGAVSEEVARAMATGALRNSRATLAVSVTGIAGPGGSEHKPEGRVCFGLACDWAPPVTSTCEFGAIGRELVRLHTREHALDLILSALK